MTQKTGFLTVNNKVNRCYMKIDILICNSSLKGGEL